MKILEVRNLSKIYGEGDTAVKALDNVSFDVEHGEFVAIVGPSGSGKSTFWRSLNLLEIPTRGKILFDGVDITDKKIDINKHRQKMGMVFQHFNLFPHKTILDNITLAPIKLLKKSNKTQKKNI